VALERQKERERAYQGGREKEDEKPREKDRDFNRICTKKGRGVKGLHHTKEGESPR